MREAPGRRERMTSIVLGAMLLVPAGAPVAAQSDKGDRVVRAGFHVTTQLDWRRFPSPSGPSTESFDVPRARIGIKGALFHRVEYEVERDFRKTNAPWRDVYVNVPLRRDLEVRAGRFKIPFSLDQLTGGADLDFVYRSLAATYLAPGRDVGVMAHGRFFERRVRYQAGAFRQGGDNVRSSERLDPQSGGALAGRVVIRPWGDSGSSRALRGLSIAAAITAGQVPEGGYSIRGHTIADVAFFPSVYVRGLRRRYGGEMDWRAGPVAVRSELIQAVDQRLGQSTDDDALPDIVAQGWYVSGTWLLTGERKADEIRPAKPFLQGGAGALEVAARLEDLRVGSRHSDQPPTQSPRAAALIPEADRAWTFGLNWYLNRFAKAQASLVREWREEAGASMPARPRAWNRVVRLQFHL